MQVEGKFVRRTIAPRTIHKMVQSFIHKAIFPSLGPRWVPLKFSQARSYFCANSYPKLPHNWLRPNISVRRMISRKWNVPYKNYVVRHPRTKTKIYLARLSCLLLIIVFLRVVVVTLVYPNLKGAKVSFFKKCLQRPNIPFGDSNKLWYKH